MKTVLIYCTGFIWIVGCTRDTGGNTNDKFSTLDDNAISSEIERVPVADKKFAPISFVNWVEDTRNGLKRQKVMDKLIYSVQYKPLPYIVCEEQKKEEISDTLLKRRGTELAGMQYFDLKIQLQNGGGELLKYNLNSRKEYDERINYFSFGMQNDVCLIQGGDTLPCQLFHFERIYDVAPSLTFLMAFPLGKKVSSDKTLILFDHGFNNGILKFFFDAKDINNVPQLETL